MTMNRYTQTQIGKKNIKKVTNKTKSKYGLYVDQGEVYELVLKGVDWQDGKNKTKELITNGVSPNDIYGEGDVVRNEHFYQAARHLWL